MLNKNSLSQAIDELPYSIRPASYSSFKKKLMENATKPMRKGKTIYEYVYEKMKIWSNKVSYVPTEKELKETSLMVIYFLSDNITDIEFSLEYTPLNELVLAMIGMFIYDEKRM